MSQNDPNIPSRKVAAELAKTQANSVRAAKILTDLDEVFRPVRDVGERNHIAWKLKQAIGPRSYTPHRGDAA
jgi:hypothetical protein